MPIAADAPVDGDFSAIYTPDGATTLLRADGGLYDTGYQSGGFGNLPKPAPTGIIAENAYVLGGYIVRGATGWLDTTNSDEESTGVSGFWGNAPAPGGGASADKRRTPAGGGLPSNGIVMFEWS